SVPSALGPPRGPEPHRTRRSSGLKLHTTAESHHRVMVLEVMGRSAGWIALMSGVAGGADVILIPEIPWNIDAVARKILDRKKNRSEEHTSELQSRENLVCRLLLEK